MPPALAVRLGCDLIQLASHVCKDFQERVTARARHSLQLGGAIRRTGWLSSRQVTVTAKSGKVGIHLIPTCGDESLDFEQQEKLGQTLGHSQRLKHDQSTVELTVVQAQYLYFTHLVISMTTQSHTIS